MARQEIISKKEFEGLCKIQCTTQEIAQYFDCSRDTVERWVKNHYVDEYGNPMTFKDVFETLRGKGKVSLRRALWKGAVVDQVPSLLIWKAKQHLGESDNPNATEAETPTINFNVTRRSAEAVEHLKAQAVNNQSDDDWSEFE